MIAPFEFELIFEFELKLLINRYTTDKKSSLHGWRGV